MTGNMVAPGPPGYAPREVRPTEEISMCPAKPDNWRQQNPGRIEGPDGQRGKGRLGVERKEAGTQRRHGRSGVAGRVTHSQNVIPLREGIGMNDRTYLAPTLKMCGAGISFCGANENNQKRGNAIPSSGLEVLLRCRSNLRGISPPKTQFGPFAQAVQ
jgi:hypothetical protein